MSTLATFLRSAQWWLLPAVVLALAVGWETDWGRAIRKPLPAEEAIAPKPVETALLPEYAIEGGVAARAETTSRTLFNPTRRPAPTAQQDANTRMQRGQFVLTGTLVTEGKSTAFLRETAGAKVARRVQQGQTINGLLVAEVRPDRVKLTLGDEAEELVLKVATNPRQTPQPVAEAPAAAVATPVAGTAAPQAGAATAVPAATPQGIPQSLAERRRAARAAEAAAVGATSPPAASVPPAATGATAPAAIDPRWEQMDQAYRERALQRQQK